MSFKLSDHSNGDNRSGAATVIKFGGSVLGDADLRRRAGRDVVQKVRSGNSPIVVVSAPGRAGQPYATDTLIGLCGATKRRVPQREIALIAGCGEIIATVLMSSVLRSLGLHAAALTGAQAGIRTGGGYINAAIELIDTTVLHDLLGCGCVPVIAGFQGEAQTGELAVLDRGGSDTTAAALAYFMCAGQLEIVTDVQGIMTADPRQIPGAQPIHHLTYEQAMLMAQSGAKVIHPDAISWAKRGSISILVRSVEAESGTWITSSGAPEPQMPFVSLAKSGALRGGHTNITVVSPSSEALPLDTLTSELAKHSLPALHAEANGSLRVVTVPSRLANETANVLHNFALRSSAHYWHGAKGTTGMSMDSESSPN